MFIQSITADVGQRFGSIVMDVSIVGSAWPARASASITASLRMERSAVAQEEWPRIEPATNFLSADCILSRGSGGISQPASWARARIYAVRTSLPEVIWVKYLARPSASRYEGSDAIT